MATSKEEAQAARLAQNAENQRKQDAFGYAVAKANADALDEADGGTDLAAETRRLNAEAIKADQEIQTVNDSSVDDAEALVSETVSTELEAYVEKGESAGETREAAPEDGAYAPEGADGEVLPIGDVSEGAADEVESAKESKDDE